ncbi:MAG: alpha/beta fold hydrolase [Sphingopyxis sp.]|nr:alpha/beta fold hydrolase [Sphingopyxis sp.]
MQTEKIAANGIEITYEDAGPRDAPVILLIMGLGGQLTLWPDEFVAALNDRGFRTIRYDNRDVGHSTRFDAAGVPNVKWMVVKSIFGLRPTAPYGIADMASDATGLLDALDINRAHVVGASMGGMIAQHVAARAADRVLSLTSVMSSTGNRRLPRAQPEAMKALAGRPATGDKEELIAYMKRAARTIGSPGYPPTDERLDWRVRRDFDRAWYPPGFARQMAAIIADGDRRPLLRTIKAPTLVIHGEDDPLVPLSGGQDTADNIPGARLLTIAGMGHDLPLALVDTLADAIADHARAVTAGLSDVITV